MNLTRKISFRTVSLLALSAGIALSVVVTGCGKYKADPKPAAKVDPAKVQTNLIATAKADPQSTLGRDEVVSLMRSGRKDNYTVMPDTADMAFALGDGNVFGSLRTDLNEGYGFSSLQGHTNDLLLMRDGKGNLTIVVDVTKRMADLLEGQPKSMVQVLRHGFKSISTDYDTKDRVGKLRGFHPGQGERSHKMIINFLADCIEWMKSEKGGSLVGVTEKDMDHAIDENMGEPKGFDYDYVAIEGVK